MGVLKNKKFTVADNFSTKGVLTKFGSKFMENYEPVFSAEVVELLESASAKFAGKTDISEFNIPTADLTNDAVTAVKDGKAYFALASDILGSIIKAAATEGVYALKPTKGKVSKYGVAPYASVLEEVAVIANSTSDIADVISVIATYSELDPGSINSTFTSSTTNKKIGYFKNTDVKSKFANSDYEFVELDDLDLEIALRSAIVLATAEFSSNMARFDGIRFGQSVTEFEDVNDLITKNRTEFLGTEVKKHIMMGNHFLLSGQIDKYFIKSQKIQNMVCEYFDKCFKKVDFILTPAVSKETQSGDMLDCFKTSLYTAPVSLAGLPSVGFSDVQLVGNKLTDLDLLEVIGGLK